MISGRKHETHAWSCFTGPISTDGSGRGKKHSETARDVDLQDLNIPLEFSRHRVDILPDLVVALVPQHCPDDTD